MAKESHTIIGAAFFPVWVVLCLTCVICACSRNVDPRLQTAESIMEQHPDSALMILAAIDTAQLSHSEDMALYGLLYTQAMDKNHLDPTDDFLIDRSVDYYGEHNDKDRLLKSTYFLGRTQYLKHRYSSAIVNFYKSLRLAEEMGDDYWAGMSCRGIADIYNKTFNTSDEVIFAKKELEYIQKSRRQPYINYSLNDLGMSLYSNGQIDSVFMISQQIGDSAKKYNDAYLFNEAMKMRGLGMISKQKYIEAYDIFNKICVSPYVTEKDSLLLGLTLCGINRLEEAEAIALSMQNNCQPLANTILYNIYYKKGDYENALKERLYIDSIANSTLKKGIANNIVSSLMESYEVERRLNTAKIKASKSILFAILSFSLLIIAVLIFIVVYIIKKNKRNMEEKIRFADALRENLSKTKRDNEKIHEILKLTLTDNLEIIDSFSNIIIQNPDSKNVRKKTADAVSRLIEDLSSSGEKVDILERKVDLAYDNLISDFKVDLPGLKDADYLLYLYSILKFSNVTISVILKEEKIEAIYNRKRRLKDKIKSLDENKKLRYLAYL